MKTIIEMAQEAGIDEPEVDWLYWKAMERFAELVRADERDRAMRENAYVLAEREASANLVDHILKEGGGTWGDAIRARGNI